MDCWHFVPPQERASKQFFFDNDTRRRPLSRGRRDEIRMRPRRLHRNKYRYRRHRGDSFIEMTRQGRVRLATGSRIARRYRESYASTASRSFRYLAFRTACRAIGFFFDHPAAADRLPARRLPSSVEEGSFGAAAVVMALGADPQGGFAPVRVGVLAKGASLEPVLSTGRQVVDGNRALRGLGNRR